MDTNEQDFKSNVHRLNYMWRNRRRMAWGAFTSIIVVTALCLFWIEVERLEALETVLTWFFMAMATIVGTYMGASTYASVANREDAWMMGNPTSTYDYSSTTTTTTGVVNDGSNVTPDSPDSPPVKPSRRKQARRFPLESE